jgi:ABC-2 type transport system ATP-binding protein
MAAIEIQGLSKTYKIGFWRKVEKLALHPLHLQVEDGEIFGYLGPNGAGKTTTLKLLMGIIFATAGAARILGYDWRDPAVKAQIGFLPEHPYFYDHLSAPELLEYYAQLSGVPAKERSARTRTILERVGLRDVGRLQLRKFSKGMLQRVGIAQAILHDPRVVFLDEPMSGLDPIGRREVRDLILELKNEGKTVFFSTHILSDAEALCDRVAVLNRGEVRGFCNVADLTSAVTGKIEITWVGDEGKPGIAALGGEWHKSGATYGAQLREDQMTAAIDAIRRSGARLVSVIPVRSTLEDYFVEKLGIPAEASR